MGLRLAIKRSYRYLIPSWVLNPRKTIRQLYIPAICYVIGLSTGMDSYAPADQINHISNEFIIALAILLLVGWWAGVSTGQNLAETNAA